ncbi:HAD-IA family hydrolase [Candidatus Acetothermia bacterium]|nr:HAD-IA family hydrolase [Candidatus Acetothermia bacterium]
MLICGLKLTHDGAIALLDGDRLVFSVEIEKLTNNIRYSPIVDLDIVSHVLSTFGYNVADVDEWAIDGWRGNRNTLKEILTSSRRQTVTLAPYRETDSVPNLFTPGHCGNFCIGNTIRMYASYAHAAGHLASAYVTSPYARDGQPAVTLIWDGGMFPRLYFIDPVDGVENGGELFPLFGHAYAMASSHFGPFKRPDRPPEFNDLSLAGKLMAYIALGKARSEIVEIARATFYDVFEDLDNPAVMNFRATVGGWGTNIEPSHLYVHEFYNTLGTKIKALGFSDEDVLASIHQFLEHLLVSRTVQTISKWKGAGPWNLCFVGGCALNIKWNSALRAHPLFKSIWVPPFPNDSGSAIGVAAAHLIYKSGIKAIKWTSRLGPDVVHSPAVAGWVSENCTPEGLAAFLHETGSPVVVVDGRAELGPRALGGRSILAPATDASMKDRLNEMKGRELYRPVAPICLEEFASEIFDPGTPDPYMLFNHKVRAHWIERIPAVVHLDGTARLQTVNRSDSPLLESVLREYHRLTGVPVLANTSANYNGRGFFPDTASAMVWGCVDAVWSAGILYQQVVRGVATAKAIRKVPRYKALFFDLCDTIMPYRNYHMPQVKIGGETVHTTSPLLYDILLKYYTHIPYEQFQDHFLFATNLVKTLQAAGDEIPSSVRFEYLLDRLNLPTSDHRAELQQKFLQVHFDQVAKCLTCPDENRALLMQLRKQYKIGLITNFDDVETIYTVLSREHVKELFDTIVISGNFGLRKPRREIFLAACQNLKIIPSEAIFIGDNLTADVAGAKGVEMDTVWMNPEGEPLPEGAVQPDYTLLHLADIPLIL